MSGGLYCPKCGSMSWGSWRYESTYDLLARCCRDCGYEEKKLPLDRERPGGEDE